MKPKPSETHPESTLADVKQLGFWAAIGSLSYVFWIVGGMEMVERLAYYGVRAVATLYATRPASTGGLGVTMATFGTLLLCWNLAQSLIPIFTGGLSDRYGYKRTIFASTVVKCFGYLIMAWWPTYTGFFVGAMFLAVGCQKRAVEKGLSKRACQAGDSCYSPPSPFDRSALAPEADSLPKAGEIAVTWLQIQWKNIFPR
ncbi:MAG: peptide MFS transporter [Verrucomicrobia bacterium]|nr:peptide MFS transporter [Verrucomicrobiota bacterium]